MAENRGNTDPRQQVTEELTARLSTGADPDQTPHVGYFTAELVGTVARNLGLPTNELLKRVKANRSYSNILTVTHLEDDTTIQLIEEIKSKLPR